MQDQNELITKLLNSIAQAQLPQSDGISYVKHTKPQPIIGGAAHNQSHARITLTSITQLPLIQTFLAVTLKLNDESDFLTHNEGKKGQTLFIDLLNAKATGALEKYAVQKAASTSLASGILAKP